ncbi:L,D-transpeptidase [Methylobacterium sp. P31]
MSVLNWAGTAFLGGVMACACVAPAVAGIVARIDQLRQRMRVSTARRGYVTPNGRFRVGLMAPMWRSRKYPGSPMPHTMFFRVGNAIHGTYATGSLGRRASHGCIRLSPSHAAALFGLARRRGEAAVMIQN